MPRIHILGASGSGTTTLGVALAAALGLTHVDSDDLFWCQTDPPYTVRRDPIERHDLLHRTCPASGQWIFSGSAIRWADDLAPFYDVIVFLQLDHAERMSRLRQREIQRYGRRIMPGGDMEDIHTAFIAWAASYDEGGEARRSRIAHENWLARQTTPILRLQSNNTVSNLVVAVRKHMGL